MRKESIAVLPELGTVSHVHPAKSTPQLNDMMSRPSFTPGTLSKSLKWRGSVGNCNPANVLHTSTGPKDPTTTVKLGPGQLQPKGCRLATPGRYGEILVGFLLLKGVLEIEINRARHFLPIDSDTAPDTYVKCYIKDGERLKYKKKTRVARHSLEPAYKQCLKYQVPDQSPICLGQQMICSLGIDIRIFNLGIWRSIFISD